VCREREAQGTPGNPREAEGRRRRRYTPRIVPRSSLVLFHNISSGSADAARLQEEVVAGLDRRDVEHEIIGSRDGESLRGAITAAAAAAGRRGCPLVAIGGDGTVNLVARAALEHDLPLGVIPAGTYNFVARAHRIPDTLDAALELLVHGTPRPIRIARLNQRRFLVNASIGLYARLLSERESYARRFGRRRGVTAIAAAASALRVHRPLELLIRHLGVERRTSATTFIIANNALQLDLVGVRDVPGESADELAALLLHPVGRLTLLAMILRGGRGELHETRELESFLFESMDIDVPRRRAGRITVALDGELVREQLPLCLSIESRPLNLLRPPRPDEAGDELAVTDRQAARGQAA